MPLYDYKCKKCSHIFEVQQRITDAPLKYCPECKGDIFRLISAAGVVFKGSGFYVTDSKGKKSHAHTAKAEKKEVKAKDSKSSAKDSSPPQSK
ncbi:MAG: FmdB family zinc ribbon protein [bacterium]